jgi:GT2 family glycosyltransferase
VLTFGIAIPHLNQAHFLNTALESLRHQYASLYLAIMDGGSKDHFREVISRYNDIISRISSGQDMGQADAIYRGIDTVEGDIVTWLNADDYYFPHILEKIAGLFAERPEVDIIYGDAVHVKPDGRFLSYFPGIEPFNISRLFRSCYICQPACFVRRRSYDEIGGLDRSLIYTMDWDLWCRLAIEGKRFLRIHEPLAAVRYYPGTKTLSGDKVRYKEIWRIQRIYGGFKIPTAWPGFYWFDLACREKKTFAEKISFSLLQGARLLKKKIKSSRPDLIYGFQRWERRVNGIGVIQFPWYGEKAIREIMLKVESDQEVFLISVADKRSDVFIAKGGEIRIPVHFEKGSRVRFSVSCPSASAWELNALSFEIG